MPRNYEIPEYQTLLEFQEIFLQAVALAWKDETFKNALLTDAEEALDKAFGYKNPWSVRLKIQEPNGKNLRGQKYGWVSQSNSWNLPKIKISVGVPEKPPEDEQSFALACYNNAGPAYLFSCC